MSQRDNAGSRAVNRQQRRQAARQAASDFYPSLPEVNARLHQLHREAGGATVMHLVRPQEFSRLLPAALAGDREAAAVLEVVHQLFDRMRNAPPDDPMQCCVCRAALNVTEFSLAIMLPLRTDPTCAMGIGICESCGPDLAAVGEKATASLRKIWPSLRTIEITNVTGGRA